MFEEDYYPISSNILAHDVQVFESLEFLKEVYPAEYKAILSQFPEIERIYWCEPWKHIAIDVDPEYSSWVTDAIEATGLITWIDGEPFAISLL